MAARTTPSSGKPASARIASIDVVVLTLRGRQLCAFTGDGSRGERYLPWGRPTRGEDLGDAAARIVREATGSVPGWIEQCGAYAVGTHPGGAAISVCYVTVLPWFESGNRWAWTTANTPTGLGERQRRMVSATLAIVRRRTEHAPIAFRLLPRVFTLSELQQTYEGLLGRRLHKASFRRALQASWLVEPMDEWRSEGRGRPAQLFRYVPHRRKGSRRGVRFEVT